MVVRLTLRERLLRRLGLLPAPVLDAFGDVLYGRALAVAVRRGVFEALKTGPATAATVASRTRLDPAATALLLEAFRAGGYLRADGTGYLLTAQGRKWLLADSPFSLTHFVQYVESLHGRWSGLEYALEHGAPARPYYASFDDHDWRIYVQGMRDLARVILPQIEGKIDIPPGPGTMLDVGGSHGLYSIACCRRRPDLTATLIDFAAALRQASAIVAESGVGDRIRLQPGDITAMDFPGGQSLLLLFNVIHGFTEAQNRELVARSLNALRPGGRLYILDQLQGGRDASTLGRFIPLMVGLNLVCEIGGNSYTAEQVKGWCSGARGVRTITLRLPGLAMIEATR